MARLAFNIPQDVLDELMELCHKHNSSPSQLGTLAVKQLLIQCRDAQPLLPPARLDKVPCPPWRGKEYGGL